LTPDDRVAVELSRRAVRDLKRLGAPDRKQAASALRDTLGSSPLPPNADDKPLRGADPWRRLRVGELRVLYRPLARRRLLVARVVHRRDLERAVARL